MSPWGLLGIAAFLVVGLTLTSLLLVGIIREWRETGMDMTPLPPFDKVPKRAKKTKGKDEKGQTG